MNNNNTPMEELTQLLEELEQQADVAANKGDLEEHKRLDERWYKLALLAVDYDDLERLNKIARNLHKRIEFLETKKTEAAHDITTQKNISV